MLAVSSVVDVEESPAPISWYNSSKLSLIYDMAARNVSPVPVFTPVPVLIDCLVIYAI